jgi:DNA-binding transcriptional MerR regulator
MAESTSASLPAKLYFRIGEVADLVGVEPHVLRYWEREFRTIRPTKSAKGQRVYSRRDVENLMRVRELLYQEGFTIAGAKKKLLHPAVGSEAQRTEPASEPLPTAHAGPLSNDGPVGRAREELLALRREIEDFLAEIEPPSEPSA